MAIRPSNGLMFTPVVRPTVTSSGAVSPMTRATASVMPDAMPAIAVGMTTLRIVRHFGTPSAYAASRSSFGTILSISSVERTTTGIISTHSATAPAKPQPDAGAEEQREQRVGEQAGDDRRDAGHDVDEEGDGARQPAAAVLHQVDRR